ncbi:MAG TPA: ethylbenzene dehydrogenase-related protein [Planctomycetota bacterium]|nr:ethylbenzene dehydrogenase-related protein [Planctomycetota bacterium]
MLKSFMAVAVVALLNVPPAADELVCGKVAKLPTIDGKADDEAWKAAKPVVVKIDQPDEETPKKTISIKAVHDGTSICILLEWADPDKNDEHSPLIWKDTAYEAQDDKVEDACVLGFELEGKFDSDMKAGIESKWDVWEWGAARTNPTGYALDRTHVYSKTAPTPPLKARRLTTRDQGQIYFSHPIDEGTPCYTKIEIPEKKVKDVLPQYPTQKPTGSAADVEAKGEWANGKWTVEFKRKLNTGHKDDTTFVAGQSLSFAVATYDKSEKGDHDVSKPILLKIQ